MELIMGLLAPYLTWIIGALIGVVGVVGLFFKGKSAGKREERNKQMEASYEAERSRVKTDADVRTATQSESDRMRQRYQRD